jgi:uncharacterized membrane protein YccC
MSRVSQWVKSTCPQDRDRYEDLVAAIDMIEPELSQGSGWPDLLVVSLAARLRELVMTWEQCLALSEALSTAKQTARARQLVGHEPPRPLHVDYGVAALSGMVVASAIVGLALFTVSTQWDYGPIAIGLTASICSLFSAVDDPAAPAQRLLCGTLLALPLTTIYEFAILPAIDGFAPLAAALFPALFGIGLVLGWPKYAIVALACR